MNALDYLLEEHKKAKAKFAEIESASPGQRKALWTKLEPELDVHEIIERMHLYGPIAQSSEAKGTKLEEWSKEHTEEVSEVKDVIKTMQGLDPSTDDWLSNLREVKTLLAEHIDEEENEIWPEIRRVWPEERLAEAGTKMRETHEEKLKAKA